MIKILILFIISFNSYSLEWNQEAFDKSMKGYSDFIDEVIDNPKSITEKIKDKYLGHIKKIDNINKQSQEYLEGTYFVLKRISYKGSKYFYIKSSYQLMDYLKTDSIDLIYFADNISYKIPLVAPLRQELDNRYDAVKNRSMFIKPFIRSLIRQQFK